MVAKRTKLKRAAYLTPAGAQALSTVAHSSTLPAVEIAAAAEYAHAEKAAATRRAYKTDFQIFRAWCESRAVTSLPADASTVATFLAHEATRNVRPSTIGRRLAAIRYAHKLAGFGNWFRRRCNEAGLPHCSAHGLRKAFLRRMAEAGCSEDYIASISGHKDMREIRTYVQAANKAMMATEGMTKTLAAFPAKKQPE
jgi:site-specific recombinase XerD